jgi:hypothetical protein
VTAESRRVIIRQLRELAGRDPIATLGQNQLNYVKRVDSENVWVDTRKSIAEGTGRQPIPIDWIEDTFDALHDRGVMTRKNLGPKASKRSAFIFAFLATLPDVETETNPITLRIKSSR